jgi:hypothetical protein
MKKIFIAAGLLIISFTGIAQITYEATYPQQRKKNNRD